MSSQNGSITANDVSASQIGFAKSRKLETDKESFSGKIMLDKAFVNFQRMEFMEKI